MRILLEIIETSSRCNRDFHRSNCLSTSAGAVEPYERNALMAFSTPSTPRTSGPSRGCGLGELGVGEVGQALEPPALAQADQPADDLVRRALGDALRDQVFHQGRRVEEALVEPLGDPIGAEARALHHHGRQLQAGFDRVERVEQRLLVLLKVAVVGQRQAL